VLRATLNGKLRVRIGVELGAHRRTSTFRRYRYGGRHRRRRSGVTRALLVALLRVS
jgi:hypothetical protein